MRKGSALLMALWTILVLGVIVMSFAFEAKLQGGINIYVEGRKRVKRLIDSGKVIGEVVLLGYEDAKEPEMRSGVPDWKDIFEDEDRWCKEKYELKTSSRCTIGPIQLDEEKEDAGTVTIDIEITKGEDAGGININNLYQNGDQNYIIRWQMILDMMGVPGDKEAFRDEDGKTIDNLQHYIIGCWNDYRDDDETRTAIDGEECGAEKSDYEEYYDDHKEDYAEEDRFEPANGEIKDLHELSRVLCFQRFPALLVGGVLNPWENKKDQIKISSGLINLNIFSTSGSEKVNVNDPEYSGLKNALLTVPGIYDEDEVDEDDKSESQEVAEAIVKCLKIMPEDDDNIDETRDWWPYKDFSDLRKRIEDEYSDVELGEDASKYLVFKPDQSTVFKMTITANLMDMEYKAECECYIKDKKIRYTSWKEN